MRTSPRRYSLHGGVAVRRGFPVRPMPGDAETGDPVNLEDRVVE
jgi:hypothetical protein